MDLEQIEAILNDALALKPPVWGPSATPAEKVGALEDYLLNASLMNARLVEAIHWLRAAIQALSDKWEGLGGWQVATNRPRAKLTKTEIQEAKIQTSPELYEAGRKARSLRDSVGDQIVRLEREERNLSRVYTIVSA